MLVHRPTGMRFSGFLAATFGLMILFSFGEASGQNLRKQSTMYGHGVHEYFDGDFKEAEKVFSKVAKAGSVDPWVFMFRGLARAKMGQLKKAKADFAHGAFLEVAQKGKRNYNVGRSLIRVQGAVRIQIENARYAATKQEIAAKKALQKRILEVVKKEKASNGKPARTTPNANLPDVSTIDDEGAPFGDLKSGS